eukprot:3940866-Rhodomonas_salina.1
MAVHNRTGAMAAESGTALPYAPTVSCYPVSGTEIAYDAMRYLLSAICYAVSAVAAEPRPVPHGTKPGYGATLCPATEIGYGATQCCGTDLGCSAMQFV